MKTYNRFVIIAIVFFAFSCIKKDGEIKFEKEFTLQAQKKQISQIISPGYITVCGDYFLITNLISSDTLVEFYKTPELVYSGGFGKKGNGPDEFVGFPMFCNSVNNYLYLRGYTPLTIKKILFHGYDSMVVLKQFKLQQYENINQPNIFKDSILIFNAFPNRLSIKKYDIKNNKLLGKIDLKVESNEKDLFYADNRGVVASNGSVIIYAYTFKKQIDIYDFESLNLKFSIKDRYKKSDPQVPVSFNEDYNTYHYMDVVAGEKFFYALYQGTTNKDCKTSTPVIEVYDYSGNPVAKLRFDIAPNPFVIDEKNSCIYGYLTQLEGVLLKYDLPQL